MTLLILGLLLWWGAHLFKRVLPDLRESLGNRGKGLVTAAVLISVVLMVIGFRSADFTPVYSPLPGMGHANNTLMLIALFLFGVGGTKGTLYPKLRHPMLLGTLTWSLAHLLVNGDLASILLFGGLGLWALVTIFIINRASGWTPPTNGRGLKGDLMNLAGTLILFGVIAMIHKLLGHPVFLGTYA
jgi:uncharacterized membrane protein